MEVARTRTLSVAKNKVTLQKALQLNFKLMLQLEDENDCSGMCNAGLFYYGRNIRDGPPKRTCLRAMEDVFQWAVPLGTIANLIGAVSFFTCVCQGTLCCRPLKVPLPGER